MLLYGTVLLVQRKYSDTGRQIVCLLLSSIDLYEQYFNAPYHVKKDEFDIQFASTTAIVDKGNCVVSPFLLTYRNTPEPYTTATSAYILILQLKNTSSYNMHILQCIMLRVSTV